MPLPLHRTFVIVISLLFLFLSIYFLRDAVVGAILEKHTLRTCSHLLGGHCHFHERKREGNSLTLFEITMQKEGLGTILAKELNVSWEYNWTAPFVTFNVLIKNLEGDAGFLPLYAAWKAIKRASLRKGFMLSKWTFEDVSLQTPSGHILFPELVIEVKKEGTIQAAAHHFLTSQGEFLVEGNAQGINHLNLTALPIQGLFKILKYADRNNKLNFTKDFNGEITAEAFYTPSGLKGKAILNKINYRAFQIDGIEWKFESEKALREWKFSGKTEDYPINFSLNYSFLEDSNLHGKISGKSIPLQDFFPFINCMNSMWECDGKINLQGEFDHKEIFVAIDPVDLTLKKDNFKIVFAENSFNNPSQGKMWIDFSNGIEKIWIDLKEAKISLGKDTDISLNADIEFRKNRVTAKTLKACCNTLEAEGELLASALPNGGFLVLAEEDKFHIGPWKLKKFKTTLDSDYNISEIKVSGVAELSNVIHELEKGGIPLNFGFNTGKIHSELLYDKHASLNFKCQLESEPIYGELILEGNFEDLDRLNIHSLNASLGISGIGKMAKFSLVKEQTDLSFINLLEKQLVIFGKFKAGKGLPWQKVKIYGPWNQIAFENN